MPVIKVVVIMTMSKLLNVNDSVDSGDGNDDDGMNDEDNGDNESVNIVSSHNDLIGDNGTIVAANSRTVIKTFVLTVTRRQRYVRSNLVDSSVTLEKDLYKYLE